MKNYYERELDRQLKAGDITKTQHKEFQKELGGSKGKINQLIKDQENKLKKDKYTVTNLFPTPVYSTVFELTEEEIKTIHGWCAFATANTAQNFTTGQRYILMYPELQRFKKFLEKQVNFYAHNVLNIVKETQFYITQSWANLNPQGSGHHLHRHPNSIISGVFFVTDNSCLFRIKRSLSHYTFPGFEFHRTKYNIENSDRWGFPSKKNTLLIFPSQSEHSVDTNQDKHPRLSLAFNTFTKGFIGREDQISALKL